MKKKLTAAVLSVVMLLMSGRVFAAFAGGQGSGGGAVDG